MFATKLAEDAVEANSVDVSNHDAVIGYCAAWRTKIARVRPHAAEPDRGRGTHTQAALRFCARAMQVATDKHGGVAHVVVCTDGRSTMRSPRPASCSPSLCLKRNMSRTAAAWPM